MAESEHALLAVDVHVGVEPIRGTLRCDAGQPAVPFTGWLELAQLLEAVRSGARPATTRDVQEEDVP